MLLESKSIMWIIYYVKITDGDEGMTCWYDAPMLVIKCLNDDDCMKPRPFLSRTLNAILTQKLPPPSVGRREET